MLLLENLLRLPRAFVEFLETGHRFHAGHVDDARRAAALIAGHEEREGFVDAVTPSGDVTAVEAVGRLFFLHAARRDGEFALAAHGFLGVSVGVVEVRQIGRHAEQSCHECHGRALEEGGQRAAHEGIDAVAKHEETDDEEEIIAKLKELLDSTADNVQATLQQLIDEYGKIGHVPFKEKDKLFKEYHKVVDALYKQLNISASKQRLDNFKSSIKSMAKQGEDMLDNERGRLMRRYEQLKSEITTYENNLGFLNASSKKGNSLIDEMNRKVNKLKDDLELIRQKIKAIDAENK